MLYGKKPHLFCAVILALKLYFVKYTDVSKNYRKVRTNV